MANFNHHPIYKVKPKQTMIHNVIISIGCIYKSLKSIPVILTWNGLCDYT